MHLKTSRDLDDTAAQFWRLRKIASIATAPIRRVWDRAKLLGALGPLDKHLLEDIGLTEAAVADVRAKRNSLSAAYKDLTAVPQVGRRVAQPPHCPAAG